MDSDPGASPLHRWGRAPGFRNRKAKYKTAKGYPLARLKWIDWQNQAELPHVEIEKEPEHIPPFVPSARHRVCDGELHDRSQYYKGVDAKGKVKESEQDFAYMLALLRLCVDDETIKNRVMNERTDWENHKGPKRMADYLDRSLEKAKSIIENSSYLIDIYRGRERKKLRSVSVGKVPEGSDHKAYLAQRVRDTVVKEGYEPDWVVVDIQKDTKNRGMVKSIATGMSIEKTISYQHSEIFFMSTAVMQPLSFRYTTSSMKVSIGASSFTTFSPGTAVKLQDRDIDS